jgi:hypothetical protein
MIRQIILGFFITPILLALLPAPVWAQSWHEYRRDDCGFKIEMPGKPEIEATEAKSTSATVTYGDTMFAADCHQGVFTSRRANAYFDNFRNGIQKQMGLSVTSERSFMMNGLPGHEFIFDAEGYYQVIRMVVFEDDRVIGVSVTSGRNMEADPVAGRFLHSFALLGAR